MAITTILLLKETAMGSAPVDEYYLNPLQADGIPKNTVAILPLLYATSTKVTAKVAKAYLDKLLVKLPATADKLIIADSAYFKIITKAGKVSPYYGTTIPGKYPGYERFTCVYVPNHNSLFKQPENARLITLGLKTIAGKSNSALIQSSEFGFTYGSDREILDSLHQHKILTADIETTGLELGNRIVSIAFAWSRHDGVAIDLTVNGVYYLTKFFESYTGKLVFHGGSFDIKHLVRNLWMEHATDYAGMIEGLAYFTGVDDTMLLAYLAKNATTHVPLSLKDLAMEYVGNYAIEIEDLSKYTRKEVLNYNLIDALATFYLWETYYEETVTKPYTTIFQPSICPLVKMMLVGLPMDSDRVTEAHQILSAKTKVLDENIQENPYVKKFNHVLRAEACVKANAKLKKLVKTIDQFQSIIFNPGSDLQLRKLLFKELKLPSLDTTKGGQDSVKGDVLVDLKNHTTDPDILDLLDYLIELADVKKINGTFIKAFLKEKDFLHGDLKLGGTQSGRLSSSDPNLTNLPAHGPMGKLTKSCIVAPPGWLFCCADADALEEKIGAILSNDPNRIKVYTDGYDGHSMRAYKYFSDQMPDIDPNNVNSINSIKDKYPELRTNSKPPTFALQYDGTAYTLHKRAGFPMEQAKQIEAAFHDLYKVSGEFNEKNRKFMEQHGYIECAFGLKLRTPIIAQCILGNSRTPYEAQKEGRSANNAVTQSWGMLLNRAAIATNSRIEAAGYGTKILPCNMIHDALYFLAEDTPQTIQFLNNVLIEEMEWNDDPAIKSDQVLMTASMDIGKSWDKLYTLPNKATEKEIIDVIATIYGSN